MTGDTAARLGRLGSTFVSAAFVLALSFAISWPLWLFATRARGAYALAVGAALALLLSSLAAAAALRRARRGPGRPARGGGRRRPA
jgi:hypothetical protein